MVVDGQIKEKEHEINENVKWAHSDGYRGIKWKMKIDMLPQSTQACITSKKAQKVQAKRPEHLYTYTHGTICLIPVGTLSNKG